MEKDIRVLEKAVKVLTGNDTNVKLDFEKTAQSIENLIKEYKKISKLYYDLGSNYCDLDEICEEQANKIESFEEYMKVAMIPKSKVRKKIEFISKRYDLIEDYLNYDETIKILEELLQEGD